MRDEVAWSLTTWEGNRRQQHRQFLALSFREKLEVIEQLGEVAAFFAERRQARGLPVKAHGAADAGRAIAVREGSHDYRPSSGGRHVIRLTGCTPEPLMSYLKALGILRIVNEQQDQEARGWWDGDRFMLVAALEEDELMDFFVHRYEPTPVIVPWSGNDFFKVGRRGGVFRFRKTPSGSRVIEAFLACGSPRLARYGRTIERTLRLMDEWGVKEKKALNDKRLKARFIAALRARLEAPVVAWVDAAAVLEQDRATFSALLGSGGGSDGNTHFSDNFMQNLWDVLPDFASQREAGEDEADAIADNSRRLLKQALFQQPTAGLIENRTSSLFDSGAVGGPNATQGFERASLANPWNVILALEGSISFAGALARKLGGALSGRDRAVTAFPFQVRAVASEAEGLTERERGSREIWLPLWRKRAGANEMATLLSEGRAEWAGRPPRNAVDMARAAASLGVDRGIEAFQRYAVVRGRVGGENYHTAASVGRFEVVARDSVDLLREIDAWLESFRVACGDENAPPRFRRALRGIDDAILAFCRYGGPALFQGILVALGRAERELATGERFRTEKRLPPLPGLSPDWAAAADDGSVEFELARALSGIHDAERDRGRNIGSIRRNLEPVKLVRRGDGEGATGWADRDRAAVWNSADLAANLAQVLTRRLMDGARAGCDWLPLAAKSFASLDAVARFLAGETDDRRIADLLWGLVTVRQPARRPGGDSPAESAVLPRAYALLKLLFLPHPIQLHDVQVAIRPEPEILSLLLSGRVGEACRVAARRLRASGLVPMPHARARPSARDRNWDEVGDAGVDGRRLAAALLVPIPLSASATLKRLVLREASKTEPAGTED